MIEVGTTVKSTYTVWTGPVTRVFSKNGRDYVTFVAQDGKKHTYEAHTVTLVGA